MTRRNSTRIFIAVLSIVFATIEWLLFELMRLPYPTGGRFLGQEIYYVPFIMGAIAVVSLFLLYTGLISEPFTRWDYSQFAIFVALLAAPIALVVFYPPWPVIPLFSFD